MKGAVIIDQIKDSKLVYMIVLYILTFCFIEYTRPTMKDLNRFVIEKYATDWYRIGLELKLQEGVLDIIGTDYPQQSVTCFVKTLKKWLEFNDNVTWNTLEVALTNVNRANHHLYPVDNVYCKDTCVAKATIHI